MVEKQARVIWRSNPSGKKVWGIRILDDSVSGGYRKQYNQEWKKRDAERERDRINTQLKNGTYTEKDKTKRTVKDLFTQMEKVRSDRSSWSKYERYSLERFQKYFGQNRKLRTISYSDMEEYAKDLEEAPTKHGKKRSPVSYNRELGFLRLAFNKARKYAWIVGNPLNPANIDPDQDTGGEDTLFKKEPSKTEFLQGEEISRLISASENWQHLNWVLRFALNTGADRSTIFNLKWKDVNLQVDNPYAQFYRPKTKDYYTVRLSADAIAVLNEIRRQGIPNQDDYIFQYGGHQLKRIDRSLKAAYKKAGIEKDRPFHCLRHTFGTQFYAETKDLLRTSRIMGHTNTKTTEKYVHLVEDLGIQSVLRLTEYPKRRIAK